MIRATFSTRPTRTLGFDLESRPSAFWYGDKTTAEITAFGWKWEHEDAPHSMILNSHGRFEDDQGRRYSYGRAYELFRAELAAADLVYGHNIRRFDLPLFQAGLLRQQLEPLPQLRTTDTLRDYPRRHDMSASLENLAKLYELDEDGKLHMAIIDWERANKLLRGGIDRARQRVVSDVLLQERLREKLISLGILGPPRRWNP